MDQENEDFDEFMSEVSSKYASHFYQMDQIIDAQSNAKIYGIANAEHIKALVRASAMAAFFMAVIIVLVHWLSFAVNESAGPITSFEILLILGLFFMNVGIYAVSIAERMNILLMKIQLKLSLRKIKKS
ncbi:hypothetical protein LBMAG34_2170 [Candidatus Saccharibacteria bacterium]|nr:hypothetical protein LBMAG34_2170 [Candidatus Saccharibacteria bacterium]